MANRALWRTPSRPQARAQAEAQSGMAQFIHRFFAPTTNRQAQ